MPVVGLLNIDVQIPECRSLKAKRKIVQSITTRLRQRFNVSVAEVDFQDKWQRCRIGVSIVSNDSRFVDSQLRKVLNCLEGMGLANVLDFDIEII
ncbi:MAG: DUF503 domain-containing protein [Nitrospinae bacterium]|nr:DUF503 domain-containing protein [Nitrospinota bacterium]